MLITTKDIVSRWLRLQGDWEGEEEVYGRSSGSHLQQQSTLIQSFVGTDDWLVD